MIGRYHNIKERIKWLHAAFGRVGATTVNNVTILLICLFISHFLFIERPLSNPPAPSAGYFPPSSGTSYKCSWRHFHKPPPLSGHDLGRTPARLSIFLQYSVLKSVYHLKEVLAKFIGKRNRDSIFW